MAVRNKSTGKNIKSPANLQLLSLSQNRYILHFFWITITGFLDHQHSMIWQQWLHRRAKLPPQPAVKLHHPQQPAPDLPQASYIMGEAAWNTRMKTGQRELDSTSWCWCNCMQRERLPSNIISVWAVFSPWWMLLTWYGYGQAEQRLASLRFDTDKDRRHMSGHLQGQRLYLNAVKRPKLQEREILTSGSKTLCAFLWTSAHP